MRCKGQDRLQQPEMMWVGVSLYSAVKYVNCRGGTKLHLFTQCF